jgi:hypothetical protein
VRLLSDEDSPNASLATPLQPNYGNARGWYEVPVSCIARYTSTNGATGKQEVIDVPGSRVVRFFLIVPEFMAQVGKKPSVHPMYGPSPWNGPNWWGARTSTFSKFKITKLRASLTANP